MFSDDNNFPNPKLTPNSASDVKVIEVTLYSGVDGTGIYNMHLSPTEGRLPNLVAFLNKQAAGAVFCVWQE